MNKVLAYLCLCTLASAVNAVQPHGYHSQNDHKHYEEDYGPVQYSFEYSVHDAKTGDIKAQKESRDGDSVKGFYALREADGTVRVVHYTADKHVGFNAVVTKSGHALHPGKPHKEGYYY